METTFIVIGGGIAGVSCAESLAILQPNEQIILVSESALIKTVTNVLALTKCLQSFEVKESSFDSLCERYQNIKIIHESLTHVDNINHVVKTKSGKNITYKYLCLCTGASPKLIPQADKYPQIIGIRDTDSVENLLKLVSKSKSVMIVGNGGIATELIYQLKNIECHWVIKDKHISATFVDPGASEFFSTVLNEKKIDNTVTKRMKYTEEGNIKRGAALGPDWYKNLTIIGKNNLKSINVHYETEIASITSESENLKIHLKNGSTVCCDLIVSATGIKPNLNFTTESPFSLSSENFLNVNEYMMTSLTDIYAAGDICKTSWEPAKHWFQMKLWTQARQMGCYAAKCMSGKYQNEEILQDFCFELFTHSTKLFGYKVILLGLFNGQKLGTDYEILLRMTKDHEYVKFVLQNNRLQGALLIGDTDLEEMCENLILNQLDLSPFGDDILNPDIDIEDYFD